MKEEKKNCNRINLTDSGYIKVKTSEIFTNIGTERMQKREGSLKKARVPQLCNPSKLL
jgi:phage antirepressor YoqD-like protein